MNQTEKDTRQKIIDAVREIAKTCPVDKITVKQISELAGVTTQTFYNHFSDKYALVVGAYEDRIQKLFDLRHNDEITWKEFIELFIDDYAQNARYVMNASKNTYGEDSYVSNTSKFLCECMEEECKTHKGVDTLPRDIRMLIKLYVGGVVNVMLLWLSGKTDFSKEEMVDILLSGVPEKIREYYLS